MLIINRIFQGICILALTDCATIGRDIRAQDL